MAGLPTLTLASILQDFERDEERSANGGSESDGEENIGWSTVNLDEEKQQQDVRRAGRGGGGRRPGPGGRGALAGRSVSQSRHLLIRKWGLSP